MHTFKVGSVYSRQMDIHAKYLGQERGGIATPARHPFVFLFTGESGKAYGYEDGFRPNGVFWYTGEGQVGDMRLTKGNAAIDRHHESGKQLLVFEVHSKGKVRFIGQAECLGHHIEQRPDRDGNTRNAIIFHLGFQSPDASLSVRDSGGGKRFKPKLSLSLGELRTLALESVPNDAPPAKKLANVQQRSEAIRLYAQKRANGSCESCNSPAPFRSRSGPFLEIHHISRLSDGGPDHPNNVIAVCPNCHRRAHYSLDAAEFNSFLTQVVLKKESAAA